MPKRTARLQTHIMHGEPELDALLADPVMRILWRADHINPDEARQFFAETTARLNRRNGSQHLDRGSTQDEESRGDRRSSFSFAMN